jgi:hypothetical protein
MPNVKPGDLAYITHPKLLGALVSVLHLAPNGDYRLPDGYLARQETAGTFWVCESLGAPFNAPLIYGGNRATRFAAIEDCWLRPLRDGDGADESLSWVETPALAEV